MTPTTLDTQPLKEIILDGFDGVEDVLYTADGLIARSALIMLEVLNHSVNQETLDFVLCQVGEHIEYLSNAGYISAEDLSEAFSLISGHPLNPISTDSSFFDLTNNL